MIDADAGEHVIVDAMKLCKSYGGTVALDDVTFSLEDPGVYGLLGRNGAGKTTLMAVTSAQEQPDSGDVSVFGENPVENPRVLDRICFIREDQKYPREANPNRVLRSAALMYPRWNAELAEKLIEDLGVPLQTPMSKLSRGQFSAVGVTLGLASRAPLTFFDEPYLGLDAVARQVFYRHLTEEMAAWPRTMVLSSHLIDEIANLVTHVLLLDHGRLTLNMEAEEVRQRLITLTGPTVLVESFAEGLNVIGRQTLAGSTRLTIFAHLDAGAAERAEATGIKVENASMQELIVNLGEVKA